MVSQKKHFPYAQNSHVLPEYSHPSSYNSPYLHEPDMYLLVKGL